MTWSVTHTIPYSSNADNHAAMVYLFDTVLAGKTAWTVSAHPDGSAFKRIAQFSVTNKITNSVYVIYSWVSWGQTAPSSLIWYEDATFTATPGDTANDTTTALYSGVSWQTAGEDWRFCSSDVNDQSVLVLKGNRLAFYWPGISTGLFWPDPAWVAGSIDNRGTWVAPVIGTNPSNFQFGNAPASTSGGPGYSLIPDAGYAPGGSTQGYRIGGNYIATNFNWLYTQYTSGPQPDLSSSTAFANGGHTDVGVWLPSSMLNSSDARTPFSTGPGISLSVGSNYWFNTWTDLGRQAVIFDFGAVDPVV